MKDEPNVSWAAEKDALYTLAMIGMFHNVTTIIFTCFGNYDTDTQIQSQVGFQCEQSSLKCPDEKNMLFYVKVTFLTILNVFFLYWV